MEQAGANIDSLHIGSRITPAWRRRRHRRTTGRSGGLLDASIASHSHNWIRSTSCILCLQGQTWRNILLCRHLRSWYIGGFNTLASCCACVVRTKHFGQQIVDDGFSYPLLRQFTFKVCARGIGNTGSSEKNHDGGFGGLTYGGITIFECTDENGKVWANREKMVSAPDVNQGKNGLYKSQLPSRCTVEG